MSRRITDVKQKVWDGGLCASWTPFLTCEITYTLSLVSILVVLIILTIIFINTLTLEIGSTSAMTPCR